jgi:hypothetical protein
MQNRLDAHEKSVHNVRVGGAAPKELAFSVSVSEASKRAVASERQQAGNARQE